MTKRLVFVLGVTAGLLLAMSLKQPIWSIALAAHLFVTWRMCK